ncbi:hypothetical protein [Nocardia sp. NPDC004722]
MNTDLVSADTARAHIESLIAHGSNQSRVARAAIVSRPTVIHILHGAVASITRDTHERIMRVRADDNGIPAGHVDSLGPRRRARALVADGHTSHYIAMRSKLSLRQIWSLIDGETAYTPAEVAAKLDAAFTVMQMKPGSSAAARRYAAARRWHLSWEWDEEDLDRRRGKPFPSSLIRRQEILDAAATEQQRGTRFRPALIAAAKRIASLRSAA